MSPLQALSIIEAACLEALLEYLLPKKLLCEWPPNASCAVHHIMLTFGSWRAGSLRTYWSLQCCRDNLLRQVKVVPQILDTYTTATQNNTHKSSLRSICINILYVITKVNYLGQTLQLFTFANSGAGNTGAGNSGPGNTGPGNTGAGNTGPGNTGPGNTEPGNTGPGNTGPGNTGAGKSLIQCTTVLVSCLQTIDCWPTLPNRAWMLWTRKGTCVGCQFHLPSLVRYQ